MTTNRLRLPHPDTPRSLLLWLLAGLVAGVFWPGR